MTALAFGDTFWFENRRRTYACRLVLKIAQTTASLLLDADEPAGPAEGVARHFPLLAGTPLDGEPGWMDQLRGRLRQLPADNLAAAGGYCDATGERFASLSGAPDETGEPEWLRDLRNKLKYFTKDLKSGDPSARDDLLNTAAALWLDAVRPRNRPDERGLSLPEDLALSLRRLRDANTVRILFSVVGDSLRQADDPSLPFRAHQMRQWRRLLVLSHQLLPTGERDAERCTQAHFAALADHIRRELPHDRNLPRSAHLIGALFYLFCAGCGSTLPLSEEAEDVAAVDPGETEEAEALHEVAADAVDELIKKAKRLMTRELAEPREQAILAHLIGAPSLLGRAARSRLPGVSDRVLLDRTGLVAALGMDERAFKAERDRIWRWWEQARLRLRDSVPHAAAEGIA